MNLALVLTHRGQQQIRKLVLQPHQPVTIGRGWHNEVIVDDEFADASHARLFLTESGGVAVEDLGTANGTHLGKKVISDRVDLRSGATVTIGDTSIAIHDTSVPVAPAVRRNSLRQFFSRFASAGGMLMATVIVAFALLMSIYTMNGFAVTGERVLSAFLGTGAFLVAWSVLAALIGKLFRNETNAALHWVFMSLVMAAVFLTGFVVDVFKFNLDSGLASTIIDNVLLAVLIATVAYVTFSLSTRLTTRNRLVAVGLLALLPVAYNLVKPLLVEEHEAWRYWAQVEHLNHPPAFLFRTPTSLDAHMSATDDLFAALDDDIKAAETSSAPDADKIEVDKLQMSIAD
jgi:hypothetical protein